jgi:hypothetical protein
MNIQNNKIITLTKDVKNLISASQQKVIRAVDFERVLLYWNIGNRIYEEVQGGNDRAEYGKAIIKNLSDELEPTYGSGYSYRQLYLFLQFHKVFPIVNALRSQLSWTQYKLLLRIEDSDKREFYIAESTKNNWSSRELKRQINASLYKRLLLSNDKKSVLEVARNEKLPTSPSEIIKDAMILEFLGLEIKTHKLTHQDIGQLQMYVNYFDRVEKQEFENQTIGVLLCADKNDTVVKYTLPKENKTILASKYQLYLPSEEELIKELHRELEEQKRGL